MFKLKYLKYKKKYLNLKNNLRGGINNDQNYPISSQNDNYIVHNDNFIKNQNEIFQKIIDAYYQNISVINLFKNNDHEIEDEKKQTPIFYVIGHFNLNVFVGEYFINLLIKKSESVLNKVDLNEETPLFMAVKTFNLPIIKTLIYNGADINKKNINGNNILFELLNNLDKILKSNNYDNNYLNYQALNTINIINFFSNLDNYKNLIKEKNNDKKNILYVATYAIINDHILNKNAEIVNDLENIRLEYYKYIITKFIEDQSEETLLINDINNNILSDAGTIGNLILDIFNNINKN